MSSKNIVLVTGASGFIGAQVVDHLLQAGYAVRGTSRSAKAEELRKSYDTPDFDVAVVDDLVNGDLTTAFKGVSSVVHVASPLPTPGIDIVEIAIVATLNVLRQAYAAKVYRIVVVSSAVAAIRRLPEDVYDSSITLTADDWHPTTYEEARKPETHPLIAYVASKTLAERAAWEFSESHPEIDLTTLLPPFVYGPLAPGQVVSAASPEASLSSNRNIYALISGPTGDLPVDGSPHAVDVRDVAHAAVLALTAAPAPPGQRKRITLLGGIFRWDEAVRHLAAVRPKIKDRLLFRGEPAEGVATGAVEVDMQNSKRFLGMEEFIGWKKTFEDAVDSILEREASWGR